MGSTIDAWLHNVGACRLSVGGMRPKQAGVVLGLRVLGPRVLGFRVLGFRVLGFRVEFAPNLG